MAGSNTLLRLALTTHKSLTNGEDHHASRHKLITGYLITR